MKVLVTGSAGMLGRNFSEVIKESQYLLIKHTRVDADFFDAEATKHYIEGIRPNFVIHCAALVGGIQANIAGGTKFYEFNRLIDDNLLSACLSVRVPNLIYISSSCMYPANTNRKLTINDIGSEPLEPSNLSYAKAKIFSTRRVEDIARTTGLNWRVLVSSNLYGPFDHFDIKRGHLIASIIAKVYAAKQSMMGRVEMWGDGTPRREFTYAPEFADWVVNKVGDIDNFPYILNVGFGADFSVRQYYEMVISTLGLEIEVISRPDFPNGNMNKLMDSSMANSMGWNPVITPEIGIRKTLDWYEGNIIRE